MSQQGMTTVNTVSTIVPPFLEPGLVWSDNAGKVFDVLEETA